MTPIISPSNSRQGITLLELLIALGLGILLIGSIGATLMVTLRAESMGRKRMERAQLVRAIYLRMTNDLRSVTYLEEFVTEEASNQTAAEDVDQDDIESSLGIEDSEEFLTPSEAILKKTQGLYGDESSLVVFVNRPERLPARIATQTAMSEDDQESVETVTDSGVRTISWFANGTSSIGSLVGTLDESSGASLSNIPTGGLSRLERDALELSYSDDAIDLLALDAELLAPEISSVQFRYFDGVEWATQWDSAIQERLPSAVEVTLTFKELEVNTNAILFGEDPSGLSSNMIRFVVAIAMAPPPLMEVEL
ncbi:MAG: hypothetical protein HUJ26_10710 [Planctomycetaceae bacterium]|nr:hypothetical protein [Planctomycetaceae bacterium]